MDISKIQHWNIAVLIYKLRALQNDIHQKEKQESLQFPGNKHKTIPVQDNPALFYHVFHVFFFFGFFYTESASFLTLFTELLALVLLCSLFPLRHVVTTYEYFLPLIVCFKCHCHCHCVLCVEWNMWSWMSYFIVICM